MVQEEYHFGYNCQSFQMRYIVFISMQVHVTTEENFAVEDGRMILSYILSCEDAKADHFLRGTEYVICFLFFFRIGDFGSLKTPFLQLDWACQKKTAMYFLRVFLRGKGSGVSIGAVVISSHGREGGGVRLLDSA